MGSFEDLFRRYLVDPTAVGPDAVEATRSDLLPTERPEPDRLVAVPPPPDLADIPSGRGALTPVGLEELRRVLAYARTHRLRVRAAGSQGSAPGAVWSSDPVDFRVRLDAGYRHIQVEAGHVRCGSAVTLGALARVLRTSRRSAGLFATTHEATVAGAITSGTVGLDGRSLSERVRALELVDGLGALRRIERGHPHFDAATITLGLLGVVTAVELDLDDAEPVTGVVETVEAGEVPLADLAERVGSPGFCRWTWFSDPAIQRVVTFATRPAEAGADDDPASATDLACRTLDVARAAASVAALRGATAAETTAFYAAYVQTLLAGAARRVDGLPDDVLPLDDPEPPGPVHATELTVPEDVVRPALRALRTWVARGGAGPSTRIDVLPSHPSASWLAPAQDTEGMRLRVVVATAAAPRDELGRLWSALLPLPGVRAHWAHLLPLAGQPCGDVVFGTHLLRSRFPKLGAWLELRREFDPDGIFFNTQWERVLGL